MELKEKIQQLLLNNCPGDTKINHIHSIKEDMINMVENGYTAQELVNADKHVEMDDE